MPERFPKNEGLGIATISRIFFLHRMVFPGLRTTGALSISVEKIVISFRHFGDEIDLYLVDALPCADLINQEVIQHIPFSEMHD